MRLLFRPEFYTIGKAINRAHPRIGMISVSRRLALIPLPPRALGGLTISGIPLTLLGKATELSVSELRLLYETYLDTYFVQGPRDHKSELETIRQRLKIPYQLERWWIPANLFEYEGGVLALLATLIANQLGLKMDGAVVDTGKYKVGVGADGEVHSRFVQGLYVAVQDYESLLHKPTPMRACRLPLYASIYRHVLTHSEFKHNKSLLTALMLCRMVMHEAEFSYAVGRSNKVVIENKITANLNKKVRGNLKQVSAIVEKYKHLSNPMPAIWAATINTGLLSPKQFCHIFDEATLSVPNPTKHKIPPELIDEWVQKIKRIRT